jgi:hypothetical protein
LSRIDVSKALPGPLLNPCGVGLCCWMKLYQSATQTAPSGPTCACTGATHSSAPASRFQPSRATKLEPCFSMIAWPTRWAVGSVMKAMRFQYCLGNDRAV